jgi:hypothetical protein
LMVNFSLGLILVGFMEEILICDLETDSRA